MAKANKSWSRMIRKAIADADRPLNAIAREAGVHIAPLQRFVAAEHGMTVDTAEKVCGVVGLELRVTRRRKK